MFRLFQITISRDIKIRINGRWTKKNYNQIRRINWWSLSLKWLFTISNYMLFRNIVGNCFRTFCYVFFLLLFWCKNRFLRSKYWIRLANRLGQIISIHFQYPFGWDICTAVIGGRLVAHLHYGKVEPSWMKSNSMRQRHRHKILTCVCKGGWLIVSSNHFIADVHISRRSYEYTSHR